MNIDRSLKRIGGLLLALTFAANAQGTDISTEPLNTYSAPSSTDVKPNVLFVLDDSGSMDWDFMPDWACDTDYSTRTSSCASAGQRASSSGAEYLFKNAAYNGVYYNPAVTYKPPVAVDASGATNTTTYPGMTGTSSSTGANTSYSLPNWKAVRDDAYGVQSTSTAKTDLEGSTSHPPVFYTIVAGEYCASPTLKECITANAPSDSYPYPAKIRWCDSKALTNCQAAFSSTFSWVRAPSPTTATIDISGSRYSWSNTTVNGITVNGHQIMAGQTGSSSNSSSIASDIVEQINACTVNLSGNCEDTGYSASRSGSTVTIYAPDGTTGTPAVAISGSSMTFDTSAFAASPVPGKNLRTVLKSTINSYPYPGSATKASTRTDCAGTTCTYAEEMTNYANWWTYYRTRMQMMKTAAGNAFSTIDSATDIAKNVSRFRLGFMSINDNTDSDFLNLGEFTGSQKYNWYSKLISAKPSNSTPLRAALSTAGRLYAGKLNEQSLNGSTVVDPLQYSCQQNYTILSTDGFWNEGSGYTKMDGRTTVGNQDAGLPRPYYDGSSAQVQSRTSTLRMSTGHLQQR